MTDAQPRSATIIPSRRLHNSCRLKATQISRVTTCRGPGSMLMLEFGSRTEFDDPKLEYRRLFSELLGTFMLVLVAAGGGILHAKGQISLAAAVVAPGLMVLAIILFMGAVSGAHLNPAVSLAFAVRGDFRWRRVPGYIIVQLARRDARVPVPTRRVRQRRAPRRNAARTRLPRLAGVPDGDRADRRTAERHPRYRLRRHRTSAGSARSASAATSPWPACGRRR